MKIVAVPFVRHRHYCAFCFSDVPCAPTCAVPLWNGTSLWTICPKYECHVTRALRRHEQRVELRRCQAMRRLQSRADYHELQEQLARALADHR